VKFPSDASRSIFIIRDFSMVSGFGASTVCIALLLVLSSEGRKNGAFSGAFGGSLGLFRC
jgi:hypothetical protein